MAVARELFIYYRAKTADATALQSEVMAHQSRLRNRFPGLQARLLRRPEPADGWHTWMETYAMPGHPDGVTEALEQSIEQSAAEALAPLRCTARHVEVFVPCAC
jgi:hypothetical protein